MPPWHLHGLVWLALVPLFEAVQRARGLRHAVALGTIFTLAFSTVTVPWMPRLLRDLMDSSWPTAIAMTVAFCLGSHPFLPIIAPVTFGMRTTRRANAGAEGVSQPWRNALLLTVAVTGLEWAFSSYWKFQIGTALHPIRHLRQIADLSGVSTLTFLVVFTNASVWLALRNGARVLAPAMALLVLASGYGEMRLRQIQWASADGRTLRLGLIQPNVQTQDAPPPGAAADATAKRFTEKLLTSSQRLLDLNPGIDALVWPESAYPAPFRSGLSPLGTQLDQALEDLVYRNKTPLLFGSYERVEDSLANTMFLLTPWPTAHHSPGLESDLQSYRKTHLFPFGEYIPLASTFPWLKTLFPKSGHYIPGEVTTPLYLPTARDPDAAPIAIAPAICYELLFPDHVRSSVRKGSRLILNLTSDAWFNNRGEAEQHLRFGVFRAIETRTPIVRATNTGISALVLTDGEVIVSAPLHEEAAFVVDAPITRPVPTLFMAWGDWLGALAFLLIIWRAVQARLTRNG